MTKHSASQKLYQRYEFMANVYARKIYNFDLYGLEKQDIVQELKLRLYYSIKKYGVEWYLYRNNGGIKPVPLPFYLQTVMNNKLKDLYFKFGKDLSLKNRVSIQDTEFDYGIASEEFEFESKKKVNTLIDHKKKICILRGVNVFAGLKGEVKNLYHMHLRGIKISREKEKLVEVIVKSQQKRLSMHKTKLFASNEKVEKIQHYSYSISED